MTVKWLKGTCCIHTYRYDFKEKQIHTLTGRCIISNLIQRSDKIHMASHHIPQNTRHKHTDKHMHMPGNHKSTWLVISNDLKPVYPKHCCLKGENDRRWSIRKEQLAGQYTHIVRTLIHYYCLMTQFCFAKQFMQKWRQSPCTSGRMVI